MADYQKVGSYDFVAEPFCSDFRGHMAIGVLGNLLLNVAEFHASDRGFGIITINEGHYTWVLSRLVLEFVDDAPRQTEKFTIETWVESVYRLFTERDFAVLDKAGNPLGYARSVWAMIDMDTRKPVDLLNTYEGGITGYVCDKECPIERPGKVKVASSDPVCTLTTRYSDIDINGHVNSIKYIDHILDLFPLDLYKNKRVKRFEIAYVSESHYGDTLQFFCDDKGSDEYHIEVKKNDGEIVCRSKVIFI
ncbi:acyl-ACP thioesterase [Bacteroides sp. CAG:144]|nr:acyl-ACP thioesterase [Bacteroides sp. CAG:144]